MEYCNKHYIVVDTQGRIVDGWSDGPHRGRPMDGAICINEEGGYQFRLWPGGEENPPLCTMDGIPLYRWDGEAVIPRTEAEIAADLAALLGPPAPDVPLCLRPGVSPLAGHTNSCRRAADGLVVVSVAIDTPAMWRTCRRATGLGRWSAPGGSPSTRRGPCGQSPPGRGRCATLPPKPPESRVISRT